eukprot:scaffold556496_cov51-Prasinocladus_malaysianus.AAC.1
MPGGHMADVYDGPVGWLCRSNQKPYRSLPAAALCLMKLLGLVIQKVAGVVSVSNRLRDVLVYRPRL